MVSRRTFLGGTGAVALGSATALAPGDATSKRLVRIEPVSGSVSYLVSVDGELRAVESLCEASDRRVGGTALGKLDRHDADEYRIVGEITRLWSTGDIRVSIDGETWTGHPGGPSAPTANTPLPDGGE